MSVGIVYIARNENHEDDINVDENDNNDDAKGHNDTYRASATPMDVDGDDDLAAALAMSKASRKYAGYGAPDNFQGHYELFAVVTHIGASANSGHYMGWTRQEKGSDKWLRFNDEAVDEAATADILDLAGGTGQGDMAYLCFYRQLK